MSTSSLDRLAHATDAKSFTIVLFLLRFSMAILFLYAAWEKLIVPDWSAAAYLQHATGPLAVWFQQLAGSSVVNHLVMYGELAIGLGFLFGCLIRPAAFFAIILLVLFYVSGWTTNVANGFVSQDFVYALVCALFLFSDSGRCFGLDRFISESKMVQSHPFLSRFF